MANGLADPDKTDGFSLNADLAACGGDELVTVKVGGVKRLAPERLVPPDRPEPRVEGRMTDNPLELTFVVPMWTSNK